MGDERELGRMEANIERLQEEIRELHGTCDKCLVKKIVYAIVGLMGIAVVGALLALVLRSPK